jgi:proteasome lid subunit RPN8/RPN11
MVIELPRSLADALVRHAREAAPDEACGFIGLRQGRIVRLVPTRNVAEDPRIRFFFDSKEALHRLTELSDGGLEEGIFHSHPASPAYPSPTDREEMRNTWPGCVQLMVSLRHDATAGPEINAYRIDREGEVSVEDLRIVEG